VHNLKTKTSGIILTPWAMFVPNSAFVLFLVSDVPRREDVLIFVIFRLFLPILTQLKTFSKNLSAPIILVLDSTFVCQI